MSLFSESGRGVDGETALLSVTDTVPALWGNGDDVLWSEGEPLMIAGPDGIGKTTLGQQLALCRVGIRDNLLGYPVRQAEGKVLYIAADRPKQAIRSMRRMVVPADYPMLRDRLVIWRVTVSSQLFSYSTKTCSNGTPSSSAQSRKCCRAYSTRCTNTRVASGSPMTFTSSNAKTRESPPLAAAIRSNDRLSGAALIPEPATMASLLAQRPPSTVMVAPAQGASAL